jgi:hypothetical protein
MAKIWVVRHGGGILAVLGGDVLDLAGGDLADHDGGADHVGGRFSPLGPRGTGEHPYYFVQVFPNGYLISLHTNDATAPMLIISANRPDVFRVDVNANALIGGAASGNQGVGKPDESGH